MHAQFRMTPQLPRKSGTVCNTRKITQHIAYLPQECHNSKFGILELGKKREHRI